MSEGIENQDSDTSGGNTGQAPATPSVEIRDGATYLDGKKMVPESDLIATKKGLEKQLETAQANHTQAIDAKMLELSGEQQKAADLNAQLQEAIKNAPGEGATSEEVARIKTELTEANNLVETLKADAGKALELRRALMALQYNVSVESLADKDMQALDSFEEALKVVTTSRGRGPGNYAVGGGGTEAAPMTDLDRAKQLIASTPQRGVREPAETK